MTVGTDSRRFINMANMPFSRVIYRSNAAGAAACRGPFAVPNR
jgi:hypothetical protein